MKKISGQAISIIIMITILILVFISLNKVVLPSNYNSQNGAHIWLSSSTIKFTNNWLKEGPFNLKFIMYEVPESIEINTLDSQEAYISYPSGCILPPYLIAKILGKSEIDISFIKHMLEAKYLLDVILISLIMYSILRFCLKIKSNISNILISMIISMFWMILPNNLYYLKNIYFSDQLIITIVLLFTLFEIYNSFIKEHKSKILRYMYYIFKFLIILYGVLVDYYFLFVVFIAFLVEIIPLTCNLIKNKKFKVTTVLKNSVTYVIPVIIGISLFFVQIINVENFISILTGRARYRLSTISQSFDTNTEIYKNFLAVYGKTGLVFMLIVFFIIILLTVISLVRYFKNNARKEELLNKLVKLGLIIYIPPIMQVLILRNHSAVHEFSTLKFGLPFIFGIVIFTYIIFKVCKISLNSNLVLNIESDEAKKYIKLPIFCLFILISIISITLSKDLKNRAIDYYNFRTTGNITYELENLIKQNSEFEDVFFSYTYEINANPPMNLSVSNKLVYKIKEYEDINEKFPNIDKKANILFVIEKNNLTKNNELVKKENDIINNSNLMSESENYYIYKLKEDLK